MPQAGAKTLALTIAALIAFAANSLLCRMALGADHIDPASFTTIRVVSGALTLAIIFALRTRKPSPIRADWRAALALLAYMLFFSFAYITLSAGAGALILFGCVQLTMFSVALLGGERFAPIAWAGWALAIGGLVYLLLPGLSAPDPLGAGMMVVAGIAWGAYSLLGRGASDPLAATAANFITIAPITVLVSLLALSQLNISPTGAALAIASGALASGCGYVIWYAALRGLTASRAAVAQLAVPVIAAIGAVLFLAEPITTRLIIASAATLGGVALALSQRAKA